MSPHFEWQAGDDDGHWETIAQEAGNAQHTRRRCVLWYVGIALLVAIVVAAACGYVIVRQRYDEASRQIAFQIQSVIDLEARAFAEGNKDLFLAQQDEASDLWNTISEDFVAARKPLCRADCACGVQIARRSGRRQISDWRGHHTPIGPPPPCRERVTHPRAVPERPTLRPCHRGLCSAGVPRPYGLVACRERGRPFESTHVRTA